MRLHQSPFCLFHALHLLCNQRIPNHVYLSNIIICPVVSDGDQEDDNNVMKCVVYIVVSCCKITHAVYCFRACKKYEKEEYKYVLTKNSEKNVIFTTTLCTMWKRQKTVHD